MASKFLIEIIENDRASIKDKLKAQEILQNFNINTDEFKKAMAKEIEALLYPGDKVYSIYQAGICYTDQDYFMSNEVDYLHDIEKVIYGQDNDAHEDPRRRTKRIYCYLEKEKAEAKAEAIHLEMIHNNGIGIGVTGFEWCKENPKFNLRQWCEKHNISDRAMWGIEYSIKDEYLADDFRRSKYIYHPKHIDTWCKDNNLECNYDLHNWDNYREVMDYLYLPENIALLSKFWKDGVGHFAFVREEIVQETISIKPQGNLIDLSQKENTKLQSLLKPENYPELASKFLIKIIESDRTNSKQKQKARQLLQNIAWQDIPF